MAGKGPQARLRAVYRGARRRIGHLLYERRLGVDTGQRIELEELGVYAPGRNYYAPARWRDLPSILGRRDVGPDDVFLDVGSGMGRVVLQAARYPMKRVIGLELSEELNRLARQAVAASSKLRCPVELVTGDAIEYQLPPDVTIVYFYNSFGGELFSRFLAGLIEAVDRDPRPLRFVYANPVERERLEATGRFRLIKTTRRDFILKPARRDFILMYELTPGPGKSGPPLRQAAGSR
jgi:SAM-dependent methyltransferase